MTGEDLASWRWRARIGGLPVTQEQLARMLGIRLEKVRAWESGDKRIPEPVVRLLQVVTIHPAAMQTLLWVSLCDSIAAAVER